MATNVVLVDYANANHAADLVYLLDSYSRDPMGGSKGLADTVKQNLPSELAKLPYAFSLLCYADGAAAGLVNCFEAFSTFACQPLINIHDIVVIEEFRGRGISQLLLTKVEAIARQKGCAKLTLEVLAGNAVAQRSYTKFGFSSYELDPEVGSAMFWQKSLSNAE